MDSISTKKLYIVSAFAFTVGLLSLLFTPHNMALAATTPATISAQPVYHGPASVPRVALTFDDGPSPTATPKILKILQQCNVHATFFELGNQVQRYSALTKQLQAAGNVIGDHTWDHKPLTMLTPAALSQEITKAAREIKSVTGTAPTLLRPPYGSMNGQVNAQVASLGMATILWNVDTVDWSLPGTQKILNIVLNNARNGSIILMHDGGGNRSQTIAALPQIIKGLQQKGFQLVTIPELLGGSSASVTR